MDSNPMFEVQKKFQGFLTKALGATYVAVRTKVVGGKDTGVPCLTIGFQKKLPASFLIGDEKKFWEAFVRFKEGWVIPTALLKIPAMIEGLVTDVIEHELIRIPIPLPGEAVESRPEILSGPAEHQKKYRPVVGGVSYIACESSACSDSMWMRGKPNHPAHAECMGKVHYGTITIDGKDYTGCWHLLTNYHCDMDFNTDGSPFPYGHGFTQPSPYDGGICPSDVVATRSCFIIPVTSSGENHFDACIQDAADPAFVTPEVLDLGKIARTRFNPSVGDECASSSRTEGTTFGKIVAVEVTIQVDYNFFITTILHCIQHTAKIAGGSSGSYFSAREAGATDWPYTGTNFAGGSGADQNYAVSGEWITGDQGYGLEADWYAHPDTETPPHYDYCPTGQHWDGTQCVPDTMDCTGGGGGGGDGQDWMTCLNDCISCLTEGGDPTECLLELILCFLGLSKKSKKAFRKELIKRLKSK